MDRNALDRYITGNYGEDQFRYDGPEDDGQDSTGPAGPDICAADTGRIDDGGPIACPKRIPCPDHDADTDHEHFDQTYERLVRQYGRNAGSNLFTSIYLGEARDV